MNLSTYTEAITASFEERERSHTAPIILFVALLLLYWAVFVGIALWTGTEAKPHKQFLERGSVTAMSAIFLAMASGLALACFILRFKSKDFGRWFWLLLFLGFLFLALDELLQFHERVGIIISKSIVGPTTSFRSWDDVIVIGYGVVALVPLVVFLPEVLRFFRVAELLGVGLGLYATTTAIDSLVLGSASSKVIPEESVKLLSDGFFALALLAALLAMVLPPNKHPPS